MRSGPPGRDPERPPLILRSAVVSDAGPILRLTEQMVRNRPGHAKGGTHGEVPLAVRRRQHARDERTARRRDEGVGRLVPPARQGPGGWWEPVLGVHEGRG